MVEVIDQQEFSALTARISRVFLCESRVEVCNIELILELRHNGRLKFEAKKGPKVEVGKPRMLLDLVCISVVAESIIRVLFEELGQ